MHKKLSRCDKDDILYRTLLNDTADTDLAIESIIISIK